MIFFFFFFGSTDTSLRFVAKLFTFSSIRILVGSIQEVFAVVCQLVSSGHILIKKSENKDAGVEYVNLLRAGYPTEG